MLLPLRDYTEPVSAEPMDDQAFEAFYRRHARRTWARLYRITEDGEYRQEVAAGTALAAMIAQLEGALSDFFDSHSDPLRSGQEALRKGTFNYNQAWDPFVPRA